MERKSIMIGGGIVLGLTAIFLIYKAAVNFSGFKGSPSIKRPEGSVLLDRAQKLSAQGDEDGAVKEIEAVIAKHPDSAHEEEGLSALASIYEKRGDLLRARDAYQKIIEKFPSSKCIAKSQSNLESVNIKILFSPIITQDSFEYTIQKGDTLDRIAKKFNTTAELVSKANNLEMNTIKAGKGLKISKAKFSAIVDKSQNILTLKADGGVVKTYRVSTGQNFSTPVGNFKITNKIVDPVWYSAGATVPAGSPDNILGSRWMGISKEGYGIHGTTDPQSIGRNITAGCVRMVNSDVEELYSIVPVGTEVVIVD